MLNLEPEIAQLAREGLITAGAAGPLIANERREIVSIYAEVRAMAWVGVMMVAGGVGIVVSKNLDRIGPLAIAIAIGVASAACYGFVEIRRRRSHTRVLDEYVLLLGALLLSADVGYIEHQFNILGANWAWNFLLLAIVHGVSAYYFDSAALVSLSVAALASWLGIERNIDTFFTDKIATAERAFACAAIVGVWRAVNRREAFTRVFDHFALTLALWGGLILTFNNDTRWIGVLAVVVLAAVTIVHGFRQRAESFVIYAFVYAVVAIDVGVVSAIHGEGALLYLMFSTATAVAGLLVLHRMYDRR